MDESQQNVQNLLNKQFENSNYLPRKIDLDDIGISYKKFLESFQFSVLMENGIKKQVPIIYINQEMFAERKMNWKSMRNEKGEEVTRPFIAMSRTGVVRGTAPMKFTIPNKKNFSFVRVPTWDGTTKGIDIYKIPQPTYVDVQYEIRFVTHYQQDVDDFYKLMWDKIYSSDQAYINVNGYYIATVAKDPGEENAVDDLTVERVFQIYFPITAFGKLIDPTQFEKINTIKKISIKICEK